MITKENLFNCSQRGCYLMQFTLSDFCTFHLFFSSIFSVDYDSYTISLNYMGYIVMEEIITYFPFLISIYLFVYDCKCECLYNDMNMRLAGKWFSPFTLCVHSWLLRLVSKPVSAELSFHPFIYMYKHSQYIVNK